MDASNLLKPALARGELRCIGATTLDEYRQYVEKDAALTRRFQPVFVDEPSVDDTIFVLRGLKEKYEQRESNYKERIETWAARASELKSRLQQLEGHVEDYGQTKNVEQLKKSYSFSKPWEMTEP